MVSKVIDKIDKMIKKKIQDGKAAKAAILNYSTQEDE